MTDAVPMTPNGYAKLKAELDQLESVDIPAATERVASARAEGDLRENAEYHGARETQGMLQAKANQLRDKLSRARIIDPSDLPKGEVVFGTTVKVKDLDLDDVETFTIVGAGEEDADAGKILVSSPLAQGLLGKKAGDTVEIQVPAGTMRFQIMEVGG